MSSSEAALLSPQIAQVIASSREDLPAPLAPQMQAVCNPRKSKVASR